MYAAQYFYFLYLLSLSLSLSLFLVRHPQMLPSDQRRLPERPPSPPLHLSFYCQNGIRESLRSPLYLSSLSGRVVEDAVFVVWDARFAFSEGEDEEKRGD